MTIIKGPRVITSQRILLADGNEEFSVLESSGNRIKLNVASTSLQNRIFHITHLHHKGSHEYHHIYSTPDKSHILVSRGHQDESHFKRADQATKDDKGSWWYFHHLGTSPSGKKRYVVKNGMHHTLLGDGSIVELWTPDEFVNRAARDAQELQSIEGSVGPTTQPTRTTQNLCGNPTCGVDHICAADYNRLVRPMGYPGV